MLVVNDLYFLQYYQDRLLPQLPSKTFSTQNSDRTNPYPTSTLSSIPKSKTISLQKHFHKPLKIKSIKNFSSVFITMKPFLLSDTPIHHLINFYQSIIHYNPISHYNPILILEIIIRALCAINQTQLRYDLRIFFFSVKVKF